MKQDTVLFRARRPFGRTAVYVPHELPEKEIPWPKLRPLPNPPSKISWWYLAPMVGMGVLPFLGNLFSVLAGDQPFRWTSLLQPLLAALGLSVLLPFFQWFGYRVQMKQYKAEMQARREEFLGELKRTVQFVHRLAAQQRKALNNRYPPAGKVLKIALNPKARRKRLWAREPDVEDFLALRIGTGEGPAFFHFANPPSFSHEDEDLEQEVLRVIREWKKVPGLPVVLPLTRVGSVLIRGEKQMTYGLLYRLIADIAVHHSPRVVRVGVITTDIRRGQRYWGWMKWLPHTGTLEGLQPPLLAFSPSEGARLLDGLARRLERLKQKEAGPSEALQDEGREAVVLIFDEEGALRRTRTVAQLVEYGPQVGVYCIFLGGTVHGVRAEIRVEPSGTFRYRAELRNPDDLRKEHTIVRQKGEVETLSAEKMEALARTLASLEPPEPMSSTALLPNKVPLADLLMRVFADVEEELASIGAGEKAGEQEGNFKSAFEILGREPLEQLWKWFGTLYEPGAETSGVASRLMRRFLHFPIGLTVQKGRLQPIYLNVLPEGSRWDGFAAYHSILIGPTGSGKSEFLKSLIWGAAYQYPPNMLNIFFIDFKGGSALEDLKYRDKEGKEEELPHLVGVVTNPGTTDPTLDGQAISRRGIYAIRLELERRQNLITKLGKSKDIWEYNDKVLAAREGRADVDPNLAELPLLPHLLIILDEFSEALHNYPELEEILDALARLGRSWGMYLILANQRYTRMEKLEANVGWRIALRMNERELRDFLHPGLAGLNQVGRGYVHCVPHEETHIFQAAYGGEPLYEGDAKEERFAVYELGPAGREKTPLFISTDGASRNGDGSQAPRNTQGKFLTQMICRLAREHPRFAPPRKVYLEPLPSRIDLSQVFARYVEGTGRYPRFDGAQWRTDGANPPLEAPFALIDNFQTVQHDVLSFDFNQGAGHLWVLGVTGSGREDVVEALVLSLAHLYTPEELWIYILDFSDGRRLRPLVQLPHVGGHVLASEQERMQRLFRLWSEEFAQRRARPDVQRPRWLWVIHNFHRRELMNMEEDEGLHLIEQLIKNGGKLGLHLLITSIQANALRDEEAANLRPRLLLNMGQRDHFYDAGLRRGALYNLTRKVPGRGLWLEQIGAEGREVQTAQWPDWQERARAMDEAWQGLRPPEIPEMPACLPWPQWEQLVQARTPEHPPFPVGLDYDMNPIHTDLDPNAAQWLVLGPVASGKTHFLMLWARAALRGQHAENGARPTASWQVWYLATKVPPLDWQPQGPDFHFVASTDESDLAEGWRTLAQRLQEADENARFLLLVDDAERVLPACPADTAEPIAEAIQKGRLVWVVAFRSSTTMTNTASKLFSHPFQDMVRRLPEERLGMLLRFDSDVLGAFNIMPRALPRTWRAAWQGKPVGRALFVMRDTRRLVQIPFLGECLQ